VNVSCPDCREENHGRVGKVMTGDNGKAEDIRARLKHSINRVESNRGPGGECVRATVLVMRHVDVFV
jgi:hypothetical protein